MSVEPPFLLCLGDSKDRRLAKTARGVLDWAPERCLGQLRWSADTIDLGLPDMTLEQARAAGARTLVVGVAPIGGRFGEDWRAQLSAALDAGLDIASGLHQRLNSDPLLSAKARERGRQLHDLRDPPADLPIGKGAPRSGRRVLTVGTDCAVGKKYTALAIWRELRARGADADFCATGQTGVLISGRGFAVDAVISDFLAGAGEMLAPAAAPDHWDVVEGQGSLFHPAYAGVTLGLLHGAQPEAIVLCHEVGRDEISFYPGFKTPPFDEAIARYVEAGRLTSPNLYCAGVSLNTVDLGADEALREIDRVQCLLDLPVIDPIRTGGAAIVDRLMSAAR